MIDTMKAHLFVPFEPCTLTGPHAIAALTSALKAAWCRPEMHGHLSVDIGFIVSHALKGEFWAVGVPGLAEMVAATFIAMERACVITSAATSQLSCRRHYGERPGIMLSIRSIEEDER